MKRIVFAFALLGLVACDFWSRETPTRGDATIFVDETLYPLIDAHMRVFSKQYPRANVEVIGASEQDISTFLINDSARLVVMARTLTELERSTAEARNVVLRVTEIATDGIAIVTNSNEPDSVISLTTLRGILRGEIDGPTLIFDNPGSGIARVMREFAEVDTLRGSFSLESNAAVLRHIAENPGALGLVGVDWINEPDSVTRTYVNQVRVLAVGDDESGYFRPTQGDIAAGKYPFSRKIYLTNAQGSAGLGLGITTFISGDIGQRIVLKAGLVPVTPPQREIIVRHEL